MTDEEFEEVWKKTKEKDMEQFAQLLELWDSMSMEERTKFVFEEEMIERTGIWEDFTSEEGEAGLSNDQIRYINEYQTVLKSLKEQGII